MAKKHADRIHAYLSASSAYRWLNCPPIISLERSASPTAASSGYAEEGTAAHELSELRLRYELGRIKKATYNKALAKFKDTSTYYSEEMERYVEQYCEMVMERVNSYDNAEVALESRVDFSEWVPEGFGTADVIITADDTIEVIDLKYGQGVKVSAYQNPQMMLYALGAYHLYDQLFDFKKVRMTIVQPRIDNLSTFQLTVEELLYWADNYVAPRAVQAYDGIGEWNVTEDAMKFSAVRSALVPRAAKYWELIEACAFEAPTLMDEGTLALVLRNASDIKGWIKDVEAYALTHLLKGGHIPGFKAVEGRGKRQISDTALAVEQLSELGLSEADIFKPQELKTLTELEKMVGKKQFAEISAVFITTVSGNPTIAPENDKRPAIGSLEAAAEEFGEWTD